jgi:hypothetical protein
LYDNVRILQKQIDDLKQTLGKEWPYTQEQWDALHERIERLERIDFANRFTDMGNGTIRDNDSGLIWLKDANCFGPKIWGEAMAAAASLADGQCGLEDGSAAEEWRLPTMNEWEVFVSWAVYDTPALVNTVGDAKWSEGDAFNRVQSDVYWSMTEGGGTLDLAWWVFMKYGTLDQSFKEPWGAYVWPVKK